MKHNSVLEKNGVVFDFGSRPSRRAVSSPSHQGLDPQGEVGFHGGDTNVSSMVEVDNGVNATMRASF